jgi:hypothetical protein
MSPSTPQTNSHHHRSPTLKERKWFDLIRFTFSTPDFSTLERQLLKRLMDMYTHHPTTVFHLMPIKKQETTYQRSWKKKRKQKMGRWTMEEEDQLRAVVQRFHSQGPVEWRRVALELNRPANSCYIKWHRYLKPGMNKGLR